MHRGFVFPNEIEFNERLYRLMPNGLYQRVLGGIVLGCSEHNEEFTSIDFISTTETLETGNA